MDRRTLLKSAAATAGTIMIRGSSLAAPPPSTANRGVWAAFFDGATRLQNDGTIDSFPTVSPYGLLSYWAAPTTTFTTANQVIIGQVAASGNVNSPFVVYHLQNGKSGGKTQAALYVVLSVGSSPNSTVGTLQCNSGAGFIAQGAGYSLVQIAWDLTVPKCIATVNGKLISPWGQNLLPQNTTPNLSQGVAFNNWGGVPLKWVIGGGGANIYGMVNSFYKGSLSEMYFYAMSSPPPDITDPNVLAGFFDSTTGKPPPVEHLTQDGSVAISEELPQIYCSGPGGLFPLSTKRHANTSAQQSILYVDDRNFFYVAAGQPQTPATADPWGNVGV